VTILRLRAEDGVDHAGELPGIVIVADRPDQQLLARQVLEPGDPGCIHRGADAHLVVHAAEPGELARRELGARLAEHRIERRAAADRAEDAAVARAALASQLASRRLPAPSMFFASRVGLPE